MTTAGAGADRERAVARRAANAVQVSTYLPGYLPGYLARNRAACLGRSNKYLKQEQGRKPRPRARQATAAPPPPCCSRMH